MIDIGDRVRLVYWPCCDLNGDVVYTVLGFQSFEPGMHCDSCGYVFKGDTGVEVIVDNGGCCVPLKWVRKIEPDIEVKSDAIPAFEER